VVPKRNLLTKNEKIAKAREGCRTHKSVSFRELRRLSLLTPRMGYAIKHEANSRGNLCWYSVWQTGTDGAVACPCERRLKSQAVYTGGVRTAARVFLSAGDIEM